MNGVSGMFLTQRWVKKTESLVGLKHGLAVDLGDDRGTYDTFQMDEKYQGFTGDI